MNRKITLILVTAFFTILFHATCTAQKADNFAGTLKINSTIELGDSPQAIVSKFGQPNKTETVFWEMEEVNLTVYHYNNGGTFDFKDNKLIRFTFTSSTYQISLGSFILKVGNHINTIASTFPDSYSNRGAEGTAIMLGPASSDVEYLNITTDSNGVITEIELRFIP